MKPFETSMNFPRVFERIALLVFGRSHRRGNVPRAATPLNLRRIWFATVAIPVSAAMAAPLTLDDAIRLALQRNQALKVSAFTPQVARANVLAEYGRFDPALTFRRSYSEGQSIVSVTPLVNSLTQRDDYAVGLAGLTPWGATYELRGTANNQRGTYNRFSDSFETFGGVYVTQPLLRGFGFGATLASLRIAKADRNIADWQHRDTVINVVTSVVVAYSNVIQFRENVRVSTLNRDLNAKLVTQNRRRAEVGQISEADVLQAQARLASREERVLMDQRSVMDAENQLRQLIGETNYPVTGPALELDDLPPVVPATIDAAADLKRAYDLRPDYQAARFGIVRRRATQSLAQNQLLPRVDFVGSYGYSGQDRDFGVARNQVRDQDARSYSAGVVVSIPLTFAEGRGRARSARLSLKQAEADIVRLEQDIAIDVAYAAGQLETARLRVAAARNAVDLAERSLDAEQKKLNASTNSVNATFLVLNAQEQLATTQNTYARALGDQRRALALYEREIGTTLQNRGLKVE